MRCKIDLAAATSVLPPDSVRLTGLLRLVLPPSASDDRLRVHWFPRPSAERAVAAAPRSVGSWEARLVFDLAWTLPEGEALEALWPRGLRPTYEYDAFYPRGYNGDDSEDFHRMLGHRSGGLDEHYGFTPPPGASEDVMAYESLLRLTYDNVADFGWGTNWIYLLVPRDDLARGDLSRIVVTGANS